MVHHLDTFGWWLIFKAGLLKHFAQKCFVWPNQFLPGPFGLKLIIWSENISSEIITQGDGHWALHVLHFVRHNMDFYIKTAFKVYSKSIASVFTVKLSKTQSFCEGNFWQEAGPSYYLNFLEDPVRTYRRHHHQMHFAWSRYWCTFGPKSHKTVQHILDNQS